MYFCQMFLSSRSSDEGFQVLGRELYLQSLTSRSARLFIISLQCHSLLLYPKTNPKQSHFYFNDCRFAHEAASKDDVASSLKLFQHLRRTRTLLDVLFFSSTVLTFWRLTQEEIDC